MNMRLRSARSDSAPARRRVSASTFKQSMQPSSSGRKGVAPARQTGSQKPHLSIKSLLNGTFYGVARGRLAMCAQMGRPFCPFGESPACPDGSRIDGPTDPDRTVTIPLALDS